MAKVLHILTIDVFEVLIDKYKEYIPMAKKGEQEYLFRMQMITEILHNFCYFGREKIFDRVAKSLLISFVVNFFRNVNNPTPEELKDTKTLNQQRLLLMEIFDILLDSGRKHIKPIQLIKNIGPDFIISL